LLDQAEVGDCLPGEAPDALRELVVLVVAFSRVHLEIHRAAAVDRENLPGVEGRAGEKVYRLRDLLGLAQARERCRAEDTSTLGRRELAVLGPGDRARRDRVDAHRRRELDGERARERGEPRFGDAVDEI